MEDENLRKFVNLHPPTLSVAKLREKNEEYTAEQLLDSLIMEAANHSRSILSRWMNGDGVDDMDLSVWRIVDEEPENTAILAEKIMSIEGIGKPKEYRLLYLLARSIAARKLKKMQ